MKKRLIRWLLKQLGYKPTKEICISITCDASQAIEEMEKVKAELEKLATLQKQTNLTDMLKVKKN